MKNLKCLFSSITSHWKTPEGLYKKLNEEFNFDFDPCPYNDNPKFDGLSIEWGSRSFCNPPYGREIKKWIKKGYSEWRKGKTVVFLLPSRTDTQWFHDYILEAKEIRFIKGRLKFSNHKNNAPFPSLIAIFSHSKK